MADKMSAMTKRMQDWLRDNEPPPFWSSDGIPCLCYDLLCEMLKVPVDDGDDVRTGRFAAAIDLWISWELHSAGFGSGLWPELKEPRVVDPEVLRAAGALPKSVRDRFIQKAGTVDANVMGSVYQKQVDVGISSWLTGPELLISTKSMSGSYGKNLANRFEEAYGDAKNLRERYPLAAHGFFFVARSTIANEASAFERAKHMLGQLARGRDVYDEVAMLVVDWTEPGKPVCVAEEQTMVPEILSPEHFFGKLIGLVLAQSPIDRHLGARRLRERRAQRLHT